MHQYVCHYIHKNQHIYIHKYVDIHKYVCYIIGIENLIKM